MPFCPKCHEEYEPGVTECFDCGEKLVDSLEEGSGGGNPAGDPAEMVAFKARSSDELDVMENSLKQWNVPCLRLEDKEPGDAGSDLAFGKDRLALAVPQPFAEKAMQILARVTQVHVDEPADGETAGEEEAGAEKEAQDGEIHESPLLARPLTEVARMGESVLDELITLVIRGSVPLKKRAAIALSFMGNLGFVATLKLMKVALEKEEEETVNILMASLRDAEYKGDEWREFLSYLKDKSPLVRAKALEVIGQLGDKSAFPDVMPLLADGQSRVRDEADNTLCLLSDEDMGFEADASPKKRARVAEKWKAWWRDACGRL